MAGFAIFKFLEVFLVERESREIRKLRRITKFPEREVAWQFSHRVNIRREFEIKLGSRIDIHGAKDKDLIRSGRIQDLRQGLSFTNGSDLVVIESNKLMEEPIWFGKVVGCGDSRSTNRREKQGQHNQSRDFSIHELILRSLLRGRKVPLLAPGKAPKSSCPYWLLRAYFSNSNSPARLVAFTTALMRVTRSLPSSNSMMPSMVHPAGVVTASFKSAG